MLHAYILLALTMCKGLGNKKILQLLHFYKNPQMIWDSELHVPFISEKVKKEWDKVRNEEFVNRQRETMSKQKVEFISILDDNYPSLLKMIEDPPIILYYKGKIPDDKIKKISIIGSRSYSEYGKKVTYDLSFALAKEDLVVVSGFAKGIDSFAHQGAIDAKGKTLAVMGCGLDFCYPQENKNLWENILYADGVLMSEFSLGTQPYPQNFPKRNRIISGLSHAVLVTQAGKKSGTLITVNQALDQGRDVYAVPGGIHSKLSEGTNALIQTGAKLIASPNDILNELGIKAKKEEKQFYQKNIYDELDANEKLVYDCMGKKESSVDEIAMKTGLFSHEILYILSIMAINGYVKEVKEHVFAVV